MKTKEELNELKNEIEALNKKLAELNEDELAEVAGGITFAIDIEKDTQDSKKGIFTGLPGFP